MYSFGKQTEKFGVRGTLNIHDVLKGLQGLMGRSPRVGSFSSSDCFEGCVTFMLLSMCDSCYCFENGSTIISNFWKQIVVSTAMWSTKFPTILGAPYNRVFR